MFVRLITPQTLLALGFLALPGAALGPSQVLAAPDGADLAGIELIQPHPDRLVLIDPGPVMTSVLYHDGSTVEVETESVWRFMCGSDASNLTIEDLRAGVLRFHQASAANRTTRTLSGDPRSGLNIVWIDSGGLTPEVEAALEVAAQYVEAKFADPVTVQIYVSMISLPENIIGQCASVYISTPPSWSTVRSGLVSDMDADDIIQSYLPLSYIPVRYNGASSTVSNENRCYFTKANYNAAIGSASGHSASMAFNSNFDFDFDPSDGVPWNKMCFISVAIHEIGHSLGFTSGVDFRTFDIEALDIYRFQRTDGTEDYNPDTYEEFQTAPRTVDYDTPNDDANTDIIDHEWRMSDGNPAQASHWRQQYPQIGIMEPYQSKGETYYPEYFSEADVAAFDAIGWDYPALPPPTLPGFPDGVRKNRYISFVPNSGELSVAFQIEMTEGPGAPGVLGWAGAPGAEGVSRVVDDPYYSDAWPAVVQVGDCKIVPVASYEVRSTTDGFNFSSAFATGTIYRPGVKWWADIVGPKFVNTWTAPEGEVNFDDVQAAIQCFENLSDAPPWTWVDIADEGPDLVVNMHDVQMIILAFEGAEYPYSDPADCL